MYQWLLIDLWEGNSKQKSLQPLWKTNRVQQGGNSTLSNTFEHLRAQVPDCRCQLYRYFPPLPCALFREWDWRVVLHFIDIWLDPFCHLWTFFVSPVLPLLGLLLLVALMLLWTPLCPPTPPPVPVWAGEGAEGAPVPALPPPPPPGATARSDREDPLLDPSLSSWNRNCKAKWLSDSYLRQSSSFTVVSIQLN